MNTPVSFELAKTLRLKGFNNPCTHLYFDGRLTEITVQKISYDDIISSRYNIAPTIAEVVMWFYEKHGIWIIVDCDCYGIEWFSKLSVASEKVWQDLDKRHKIISASKKIEIHTSPTEAYEAAIEYTLKNLIL